MMDLREYYEYLRRLPTPQTPAQLFVEELMKKTGRTRKTVTQWIYGCQPVPLEFKGIIEDMINKNINTPKKKIMEKNSFKVGDIVIVPAEVTGYGIDIRSEVEHIETYKGYTFVTVKYLDPYLVGGRMGKVCYDFHIRPAE